MTHFLPLLVLLGLLQQVQNTLQTDPAQACSALEHVDPSALSRRDAARYAVLRTQADDKCLVLHTSDSLILTAVSYYNRPFRSVRMRALAQFYLGSVCRDLGDDFRAVEAYLPAADAFARQHDDVMLRRTSQNIASHLFNQHLFDESSAWYHRAYEVVCRQGDSLRMITPLEGMAKCQMAKHDYEASCDNYEALFRLSEQIDNATGKAMASEQLSILYRYLGDDRLSLSYALLAASLRPDDAKLFPYYLVSRAYSALGQPDSAAVYLQKLGDDNGDIYLDASVSNARAEMDSLSGDFEQAFADMQQYAAIKHTIADAVDRVRMHQILDDYARKVAAHRQRVVVLLLLAVVLVATLLFLLFRSRHRRARAAGMLFKQQLDSCMNQFLLTPWNEELTAIHLSRTRGFDTFSPDKADRLRQDLFRIFRPVEQELRLRYPMLGDSEMVCLFLYRLGFSTYAQSICTGLSDTTIRTNKHRLKQKISEPYLSLFNL